MKKIMLIVGIAVVIYGAFVAMLYMQQHKVVFRPGNALPPLADTPLAAMQEVRLTTADGLSLVSWYKPAVSGKPTLVLFHGNGGTIAGRGKARWFYEQGYGFLSVEYRGYGGNPGVPSEEGFRLDAAAAHDFLNSQQVAASDVILWGESLGSGVATWYATQFPAGKLILQSAFTSITDVAASHYWYVPFVGRLVRYPFDNLSRLPEISIPVLICHGEQDDVVPVSHAHTLYAAANSPRELWLLPEGTHVNLEGNGMVERIKTFVDTDYCSTD